MVLHETERSGNNLMGFDLAGSMGSSSNQKRTTVTNVSQAAESTAIGGTSMLGQVFLSRAARFVGNLTLAGPTDQSRNVTISKTGASVPTGDGASVSGSSGITGAHLFGLTWTQWAIVGGVAILLYWFYKRKRVA